MPADLSDSLRPLAVVTGGSRGIGYELAKQFLAHGFDLVINSDDQGRLAEARQSLAALDSAAKIKTVEADLATREGVEKLHGAIQALGRPVDALAANAGVGVGGD